MKTPVTHKRWFPQRPLQRKRRTARNTILRLFKKHEGGQLTGQHTLKDKIYLYSGGLSLQVIGREWPAKLHHVKERFNHRAAIRFPRRRTHKLPVTGLKVKESSEQDVSRRTGTLGLESSQLQADIWFVMSQSFGPWVSFPSEPAHLPRSKLYPNVSSAAFTHC